MNYLITPPNTHYDGGLGITACNFSQAADTLRHANNAMDGVLPLCYLQRHAVELFLKSLIVILHKKYEIAYGEIFSAQKPAAKVGDKWIALSSTHNLSDLFGYFQSVLAATISQLPPKTDWSISTDIDRQIQLVSGSDPKSTYFRYPDSANSAHDARKSSIQPERLTSMIEKLEDSKVPVKCTLLLDENDEIVAAYDFNSSPIPKVLESLEYLSGYFYNLHAAFRYEITNGL